MVVPASSAPDGAALRLEARVAAAAGVGDQHRGTRRGRGEAGARLVQDDLLAGDGIDHAVAIAALDAPLEYRLESVAHVLRGRGLVRRAGRGAGSRAVGAAEAAVGEAAGEFHHRSVLGLLEAGVLGLVALRGVHGDSDGGEYPDDDDDHEDLDEGESSFSRLVPMVPSRTSRISSSQGATYAAVRDWAIRLCAWCGCREAAFPGVAHLDSSSIRSAHRNASASRIPEGNGQSTSTWQEAQRDASCSRPSPARALPWRSASAS